MKMGEDHVLRKKQQHNVLHTSHENLDLFQRTGIKGIKTMRFTKLQLVNIDEANTKEMNFNSQ